MKYLFPTGKRDVIGILSYLPIFNHYVISLMIT